MKYADLARYTKEHHVNWNTDLFDVLRGFFEQYSQPPSTPCFHPDSQHTASSKPEGMFMQIATEFQEPDDGEYTTQDLLNLFNT